MSSDTRREYQVPVILDVTAENIEAASEIAITLLEAANLPGQTHTTDGLGDGRIESWRPVERVAMDDLSGNEHGVVVFEHDLDYLHMLLKRIWANGGFIPLAEQERHLRLMAYFDRETGRCGSDTHGGDEIT